MPRGGLREGAGRKPGPEMERITIRVLPWVKETLAGMPTEDLRKAVTALAEKIRTGG